MKKFKKIKHYFGAVRREWRTKLKLVIRNDMTHQDKFSISLTPRKVFVVVVCSTLLLLFFAVLLIAFTPLRVYIPGYTNPNEINQYKELVLRVDSVEQAYAVNQLFLDNFYRVLNEEILPEEEDVAVINQKIEEKRVLSEEEKRLYAKANMVIQEEAEMIYKQITEDQIQAASLISIGQKADISTVALTPPTYGAVVSQFDLLEGRHGVVIKNRQGTIVSSVADGVIIYTGYDISDGYTIVIQHPGNLISIYKHNGQLLKNTGKMVKAGEAVARMGNSGISTDESGLYFELWFNGAPINPLHYIVIN